MELPSWTDENLGTMKRAALWLATVVGEDGVFTKEDLYAEFPGVAQIDRRVRDLRKFGWSILTKREDPSLDAHEQRLKVIGTPVWEAGRATLKKSDAISQTTRREVLERDGRICRSCGIAAGEEYPDGSLATAQLDIARRVVKQAGQDGEATELVTECSRCRIGGVGRAVDLDQFLAQIGGLSQFETGLLGSWVKEDHRQFSEVEKLWATYRQLPAQTRKQVRDSLLGDAE
ncbi:hypothetical protein AB0J38_30085 [Streptomyces sp. NPDC050095]|uniref:hypothetical protein n=1 Tax=unclassified Streptomyces TaxID=2593676 RepID=UPI00342746D8